MLICAIDLETTGLDPLKGHKIIEIAMLTYDANTGELVDSYVQRIDPERAIDPGAQAVHGISYSDLVECPKFAEIAEIVAAKMKKADALLAHNLSFDASFLGVELTAAGVEMPELCGIDTMDARWACPDGKSPRLGELAFALGIPYDPSKAHGAEYDIEVTAACFFAGFKRGFYKLPNAMKSALDFDTLQERKVA